MTLTLEATYKDGVFVPVQQPDLANHDRVRLIVEAIPATGASGAGTVLQRGKRRIHLDAELACEIASGPEFHPDRF